MPHYFDKKTKTYSVRFYINKKQIHRRGFKTAKEAKEFEREHSLKYNGNSEMTFRSLYDLYSSYNLKRVKESTTNTKNRIYSFHILPFFENYIIKEITPLVVSNWQTAMLGKGLKPSYLTTCNGCLRSIFKYANIFYDIEDPMKKLGPICPREDKEIEVWSVRHFNIFFNSLKVKMHKALFFTLFWTGIRIGELLALTYGDIDFENEYLNINKTFNGLGKITTPKTKKSIRKIKMSKELILILKYYTAGLYKIGKNDRIFITIHQNINNILRHRCKILGLPKLSAHGLRHSHTSVLMSNGGNFVAISKRLGHKNLAMTLNRYSHLLENDEDNLVKKIDDLNNETKTLPQEK